MDTKEETTGQCGRIQAKRKQRWEEKLRNAGTSVETNKQTKKERERGVSWNACFK